MWLTRKPRERRENSISIAAFAAAILLALGLAVSGWGLGLESSLRDWRDQMRVSPATGDIVIVEIDGKSLEALPTWPWPRSHYAQAIRKLDAMGASQIAFDVDFSSRSDPENDAELARAFAAIAQPALLPTFRQRNSASAIESYTEALPIEEFREHTFVASVNVVPAANGRIIRYPNGVVTNGVARPSLANMLARSDGEVGNAFRVDQAIDINTIPRISFIDLVEGRVDSARVRGKHAVIGATAIELFDRYPTALFGVQPGVAIQVQAAETLLQDRVRSETGQVLPLLVTALLLAGLLAAGGRSKRIPVPASLAAIAVGAVVVGFALALDQRHLIYVELTAPIAFVVTFFAVQRILVAAVNLEAERMTDTATGLANHNALGQAVRSDDAVFAARIADFSDVGSLLDHDAQVQLEVAVARRLQIAAGGAEIYRLEPGTYCWIAGTLETEQAEALFVSARALFNAAFTTGDERFQLTPAFGLAKGDFKGAATTAKYAASEGRLWASDADEQQRSTQFKMRILAEIDDAIESGAITVVFQPKIALQTGLISGAECLVRWTSPQFGQISPAQFIPVLEDKNRISGLTHFVFDTAVRRLEEAASLGHALNLAVNISAQLLSDPGFIAEIVRKLRIANFAVDCQLTLEITESAPLADSTTAKEALNRLVDAGARISIDDYGTGQATLNYLQDFPAQELKLDQSFVRGLVTEAKDQIMVRSTIELAHALGFAVVGEGIEDEAILNALRELGCDYGQGWHTGRPVKWERFLKELNARPTQGVAA
ncbi:EAL domain-containing protein [Qipengyuania nanhaisediminis]|uniref:EAL domain-containing protein n=1 Tax=Qipengyuania nanhaisediminis TaxID=604088 RepID=UPI0038B23DF5